MCTLTYVPLEGEGFLFTTNRDERMDRLSVPPTHYVKDGRYLLYPKDLKGTGSWMATDGVGVSVCLLNGAFHAHVKKRSYVKSRGVVLLDFFCYSSVDEFLGNYIFKGIEPFTLFVILHDNGREIHQIKWDGSQSHHKTIDANRCHLWSSVTLYDSAQQQERHRWFKKWQNQNLRYNWNEVLDFHRKGGVGDPYIDMVMQRSNKLGTVSITSIRQMDGVVEMFYQEIKSGKQWLLPFDEE